MRTECFSEHECSSVSGLRTWPRVPLCFQARYPWVLPRLSLNTVEGELTELVVGEEVYWKREGILDNIQSLDGDGGKASNRGDDKLSLGTVM